VADECFVVAVVQRGSSNRPQTCRRFLLGVVGDELQGKCLVEAAFELSDVNVRRTIHSDWSAKSHTIVVEINKTFNFPCIIGQESLQCPNSPHGLELLHGSYMPV
jgi:hypothetical protein